MNYNKGGSTYSTGKCELCSSSCLTCSISPNRCTSCPIGYNLSSFKCFSNNSIKITITLTITNTSSIELTNNFKQILRGLCSSLGSPYNSRSELLNLISFQLSSLIINASASIPKASDSTSIYNTINNNLLNTTAIFSYPVASYSVQAVGFTPTATTTTTAKSTNVGLIVGVVIAVLVIFIIFIMVAVYCYRKKK